MRRVLRVPARLGLWLLVVVGGCSAFVWVVVLLAAADSEQGTAAIALIVASMLVIVVALWGLRRTPRLMPAKGDASALLADARERLRADQPIVLPASRYKWAWMLVGCSVFTAISGLALVFGLAVAGKPSVVNGVCALFFGAGVVLSVLQLRGGRAYLRIARDGLVARAPIRGGRWEWNQIEHVRSDQPGITKLVVFDRRDVTPESEGLFTMIDRAMTGADAALPDTYGLSANDLATLLEEARERYARERA